MKAYLIDPINKMVSVVDYNGDYQTINKLINSQRGFDAVYGFRNEDTLYVDDEGLLTRENYMFVFDHLDRHNLFGNGLILGTDTEGESMTPEMSLNWYREKITFSKDFLNFLALCPP